MEWRVLSVYYFTWNEVVGCCSHNNELTYRDGNLTRMWILDSNPILIWQYAIALVGYGKFSKTQHGLELQG